jgi:cytochrome c-type biogenesis protein CcmH/NrfF
MFTTSSPHPRLLVLLLLVAAVALPAAAQEVGSADPAPQHQHRNISGTGPGPQGPLVERSEAESEKLYQSLKGFLMSPYCPGLTLGSCGSGAAELLRADMREWVFEGHTREDIVDYYVATFGEEFLGRPPFRGTAILVWVAPIIALLVGLWAAMRWIRKNSGREKVNAAPQPVHEPEVLDDAELDARLEAEIKARSV